jgi:rod shape determining protein RodA
MTLLGTRPGNAAPASLVRRLDWVLLAAVLALTGVSSLLVYSATKPKQIAAGGDPQAFLIRHLLFLAVGLVLCAMVALSDHRLMRAYTPLVYLVSIAGLVAVLSPLGSTINGSHSWIKLPGGFSVQPSEFAKVAVVLSLAMILGERRDREAQPERSDLLLALGVAAVPMALVMLQPDLGTTVVIGSVVLGMLAVAGTPLRWMLGLVGVGVLAVAAAVAAGVLDEYQVDRFAAFANPDADPRGVGYNVAQARIAIGAGGWTGTGLFQGSQTNGRFVPEQQTDFVFTVAGEELGFLGAGLVIALLGVVMWRALRIAANAGDLFGRLAAVGVVSWFAFQTFENVGMNLGIMPVTGVPLPFVSYGGSSMLANLMAVGLLLNVHLRHNR